MATVVDILATVFPVTQLAPAEREALLSVQPKVALTLVRFTYRELKNSPLAQTLLREVVSKANSSEFSLCEWLEQLVCVYQWLNERQSSARFADILEYVSCAFEGSDLQPGHSLLWYLEHYGFLKSVPLSD